MNDGKSSLSTATIAPSIWRCCQPNLEVRGRHAHRWAAERRGGRGAQRRGRGSKTFKVSRLTHCRPGGRRVAVRSVARSPAPSVRFAVYRWPPASQIRQVLLRAIAIFHLVWSAQEEALRRLHPVCGELLISPAFLRAGVCHCFVNNSRRDVLLLVGGEASRRDSRIFISASSPTSGRSAMERMVGGRAETASGIARREAKQAAPEDQRRT